MTTINEGEVPLAGDLQLNREDHFAYIKGYQDGTVRPNNPLTRAQVATIYYRLLTDLSRDLYFQETNDFTDVPDDFWACKAISTLANAGIINGFQDGTFRPNAYITRAQFAAMTARFEGVISGLENPFADVSEDYWALGDRLRGLPGLGQRREELPPPGEHHPRGDHGLHQQRAGPAR